MEAKDVGIIALEVYFPSQYVEQRELEKFCSSDTQIGEMKGKFTEEYGQVRMGFCGDNEDIISLCLTSFSNLMEKADIDYTDIGHLSVGTASVVDKSKSVKSCLMQVLEQYGNTDVEGIDNTSGSFAGTAALFDAVNWVYSSAWDGRYAVVVCGDIVAYQEPSAQATGGAGAVAMVVGPGAALVLDNVRQAHTKHTYDAHHPELSSEHPRLDWPLFTRCYFSALDSCYDGYLAKARNFDEPLQDIRVFDSLLFQARFSQFSKIALAHLKFKDFLNSRVDEATKSVLGSFRNKTVSEVYNDQELLSAALSASADDFSSKTNASLLIEREVGCMGSAGLYAALASLLCSSQDTSLHGHRIGLFSYGSGLQACLFSLTVNQPSGQSQLRSSLSDVPSRLASRTQVSVGDYVRTYVTARQGAIERAPYTPMAPGTYYLEAVDDKCRRSYERTAKSSNEDQQANGSEREASTAKRRKVTTNGEKQAANDHGNKWPQDVGIIDMEVYFPSQYVEQSELEEFDQAHCRTENVNKRGKYTKGFGQTRMGFCTDVEDVNSICLTALSNLMERSGIAYSDIGLLEVGTESKVDKSKSVQSVLMSLLAQHGGSTDVLGCDGTNACYGGTAALLKAVNWLERQPVWDGRYAVVVCGDIAVYGPGPARPTGGAGAVALLVGPGACLVLDRGLRSSHMRHTYDFYKPRLSSEYPEVDGSLSIQCYFSALDACYAGYWARVGKDTEHSLAAFSAVLFHSPYCKLVQKSFARLAFNDFLARPYAYPESALQPFSAHRLCDTYSDKAVMEASLAESRQDFGAKTEPSLLVSRHVGNMYTGSLYANLAGYLASCKGDDGLLEGQRVCLFSFGSGMASTMFSLTVKQGKLPKSGVDTAFDGRTSEGKLIQNGGCHSSQTVELNGNGTMPLEKSVGLSNGVDGVVKRNGFINGVTKHKLNCVSATQLSNGGSKHVSDSALLHQNEVNRATTPLQKLVEKFKDLELRLDERTKVSPEDFTAILAHKEENKNMAPHTSTSHLAPTTYHLLDIDSQLRRSYGRTASAYLIPESPTPVPSDCRIQTNPLNGVNVAL